MKRFAVGLTVVALVAPMVLGLHPSTASASAPAARISIHQVAYLVTTPPGPINVTVTYNCAPTSPTDTGGSFEVNVAQSPSYGFGFTSATCDDKSHTTTVEVFGDFTQGPANASAYLSNADGSAFAFQNAEITIKS